ncbi:hypothetical protein HDU79_007001 [Rhizoclosmatium sp. JEL0117]|nr:hypothetical protein HDU79_007001 [Rhizoclosmatium sp. JEL0117]
MASSEFESTLAAGIPFAQHLLSTLKQQHEWSRTHLSRAPLDHLCLRVGTVAEYDAWAAFLNGRGSLLVEAPVAGRNISTFRLADDAALHIDDPDWEGDDSAAGFGPAGTRIVRVIELPSPKEGSVYSTGWEHAEFALRGFKADRATSCSTQTEREHNALTCLEDFANHPLNKDVQFSRKSFKKGGFNIDLRWDPIGQDPAWSVKFHWLPLEEVIAIEKEMESV